MGTTKQLMTILTKIGVTEPERRNLILDWTDGRTNSTKELTNSELDGLCDLLNKRIKEHQSEMDVYRKRLIAVLFSLQKKYNRLAGKTKEQQILYIKKIACIAASVEDFNKIPKQSLISLYNAFVKENKYNNFSSNLVEGWKSEQTNYN